MDLPRHPDTSDDNDQARADQLPTRPRRIGAVLVIAGVGLVVLMVVLHLTGVVGAGSH